LLHDEHLARAKIVPTSTCPDEGRGTFSVVKLDITKKMDIADEKTNDIIGATPSSLGADALFEELLHKKN